MLDSWDLVDANGANGQADANCDVVPIEWIPQAGDSINSKVWIQDGPYGDIERANYDEINF